VRTPTWAQVEEFCRKDRWEEVRATDHVFFRKVLQDGSVLETHRSFSAKKSMSEDRFALILRTQLRVTAAAFWDTLRSGRPAPRPSAPLPASAETLPGWLVQALIHEVGLSAEVIAGLDERQARRLLADFRSQPR
jgi:hypothetical protein